MRRLPSTVGARRTLVCLLLAIGAGCGGGDDNKGGPGDASAESATDGHSGGDVSHGGDDASVDARTDGAAGDAPADDGGAQDAGDSAPADADAASPQPIRIASSTALEILGLTSDDHVLYLDHTTFDAYVLPLGGGNPTLVGSSGDAGLGQRQVALLWSNLQQSSGTLTIWTAAHGVQVLGNTSLVDWSSVSEDSSHVVYVDNARINANGSAYIGDVYVSATDGTGKTALVLGACLDETLWLQFAKSTLVLTTCAYANDAGTVPDGGAGYADLSTFSGQTWTETTLATGIPVDTTFGPPFLVDDGATTVVARATGMKAFPIGGGAGTLIDANGLLGALTANGKDTIYPDSFGALKRSPLAAPNPLTLVSGGLVYLNAVSPDEKWAMTALGTPYTPGGISLASATQPGPLTTLAAQSALSNWSSFTSDSSQAVFFTNVSCSECGGTLQAAPTGGGPSVVLSASAWQDDATSGAKVLLGDNYSKTGGVSFWGHADIEAVDLAKGPTLQPIVPAADAPFYLTSDKTRVVYGLSYMAGQMAGLWVLPVP
jgi:hypothetical protein